MRDVAAWERTAARPARYAPFPATLDLRLKQALNARGIDQLYTHQAAAVDVVARGQNMWGEPVFLEGSELLARAIQHETDHLDGILFIDRLDRETRLHPDQLPRPLDRGFVE